MPKKNLIKLTTFDDANESSYIINPITFFWGKLDTFIKDKKFKKVTKEIEEKEEDFSPRNPVYYLFFDYKMKCYLKMIKHKLSKLLQNSPSTFINMKLKKEVESMLDKIQANLQITLKKAKSVTLDQGIQERLVQDYTEALFLQARYCKHLGEISDCVSYLSIGHNVLKNFIDTCKEPKTLSIYQNILILLSTILISDKDYQTSIEYLKICLKFCFQEIFIRIDIERGVAIDDLPDKKRNAFNRIIKNIIICLFHIGICYENLDSLLKAIEAYKQTRFFCDKFYFFFNPIFGDIIRQNEKRAFKYYDLYLALLEEKELIKKKEEEALRLKLLHSKKNNELTRISTGMNHNLEKYDSLSKILTSHNIPEIKTISVNEGHNDNTKDPYQSIEKRSTYLLTSLNVYNDLLSKQYHHFLIENDELNVNKFTKQIKENLDRYNTKLRIKRLHQKNKQVETHNHIFNLASTQRINQPSKNIIINDSFHSNNKTKATSSIDPYSQKKQKSNYYSTRNNVYTTASSRNNKDNKINLNKSESNQSSEISSSSSLQEINQQKRSKTNYSKMDQKDQHNRSHQVNLFGKKYQKKISYLENAFTKEVNYQKKLMHILKGDTKHMIRTNALSGAYTVDEIKQKEDAKSLYTRLKLKVNDQLVKEKNTFDTEIHQQRAKANEVYIKKIYVFEEKTITGLNTNVLDQMQNFVTTHKEMLKKAYLSKRPNQTDQFKINLNNVYRNNNDFIASLSRDIDICEKKTNSLISKR